MRSNRGTVWRAPVVGLGVLFVAAWLGSEAAIVRTASAAFPWFHRTHRHAEGEPCAVCLPEVGEGQWYWIRSPEQERQAVMSLYARYCIRCHGVDGRGVWDIPGVPDFTDPRWQASRDDSAVARAILEGRGACMPPFRGTVTLEEAFGMARYLRTFVPGTEIPRPVTSRPPRPAPAAGANDRSSNVQPLPSPPPNSRGAFAR